MVWTHKANLRGPAGLNATGAAEDDAAIAAFLNGNGTASADAIAAGIYAGQAGRPQLPGIDKMLERFSPGHPWASNPNTPAATVADDPADFALGTQSLRFTTPADGTPGSVQGTGYAIDLTGKQLVVWLKITGSANLTELIFYAGDTTLAKHYSWTVGDNGGREQQVWREGQWTPIVLSFADGQAVSGPNRALIQTLRIRARGTAGNTITVRIGAVGTTPEPKAFPTGVISYTCDDSYISQYTIMRRILDKYGRGATAYQIAEFVGTPGFCSLDQLHALERGSGWEIAGHSFTNAMHSSGFGELSTADEVETDLRALRKWLLENKFKGADHLAYPRGYFSAANEQIVGKYFATARTVINRLIDTVRPSDRLRLRSLSVSSGTTLATAKAYVDKVKAGKAWGIITIHDLIASPTTGTQWPTADFEALVDYIEAQGIPVMNVSEVVARLNAPDALTDITPAVTAATAASGAIVQPMLGNTAGKVHSLNRLSMATPAHIATVAGRAELSCFAVAAAQPITRLTAYSGNTAWTGHTLARIGLYTVDAAGNVVLVARTASDTTLFTAANTLYQRVLDPAGGFPSTYTLQPGQLYAAGVIGVGQTAGQIYGVSMPSPLAARLPVLGGWVGAGAADLPASGTITVTGNIPWIELAS